MGDSLNDNGEIIQSAKTLQEVLDAIFPYLVPISITSVCYHMVKTKKTKPLTTIAILFVIGFILGALGWMA